MANMPSLSTFPLAAVLAQARTLSGNSQVRSGLSLSAVGAGSLGITVASGTAWVDGTYVSYAGGTVTPGAASATLHRYDLIVILSGATAPSVVAGTAASAPVPPTLASGALLLGYLFIGAGATDYATQATAFIADYTMPFTLPAGTAANPAQVFTGDLTTGPLNPGTGRYQIATGGVARHETTSAGHFVPVSTSITDLGTSTLRWRDVNAVSVRGDVVSAVSVHASTVSVLGAVVAGTNAPLSSLSSLGLEHSFRFRVFRSVVTSIPTTTGIVLNFDSTRFDPASMHSSTTSTSEAAFAVPGTYLVGANVEWSSPAGGQRSLQLLLNGTTIIAADQQQGGVSILNIRQEVTTLYQFVSTDRLSVRVSHNVAASLNINNTSNYSPEFWGVKVG